MDKKYSDWISANVSENGYGKCAKITDLMASAFPELKRVRGHYYDICWGERAHWWLVDEDGGIVDPTAAQFPSRGTGFYDQWEEGREEPTGWCPNCGGYVFGHKTCCSDRCHIEYAAFCMNP